MARTGPGAGLPGLLLVPLSFLGARVEKLVVNFTPLAVILTRIVVDVRIVVLVLVGAPRAVADAIQRTRRVARERGRAGGSSALVLCLSRKHGGRYADA